jgi:hypothetical protein
MSIFARKDGAEGVRESRKAIADEFERRRTADEQRATEAAIATRGPTAEQAEAAAKARIGAGQAATAQRNAEIQRHLDQKQEAARLAAQAESERNQALAAGDIEAAITAQMRVTAAGFLPALIDEDVRRRFPPLGFHF